MVSATIVGVGSALPPAVPQERGWQFFRDHYHDRRAARRIWEGTGIRSRHVVADPTVGDVSGWGTEARMRRFREEALPLGKEALAACLADARLDPAQVDLFVVVSCTGYVTPGLDVLLARDVGMPPHLQRLHVGHMGCYAALPGLATAADAVRARHLTAVVLCVELSSLHIQPPSDDLEQAVAHALFADAAAAVALVPGGAGLEVVDVTAHTDSSQASCMTWDVTDRGFRLGLSRQVPTILRDHVGEFVTALLSRRDVRIDEVAAWAVHPGGPRILDAVADRLGLADSQLTASRRVLRDCGNCSSATVVLILQELLRTHSFAPGDHVVALAFGPGLTLFGALLRVVGDEGP
ncbi:MAG: type III polyketide synthase [Actinobacteria bacterium]|nr:type III polyketide synthase [Actinomycetota bacterium]